MTDKIDISKSRLSLEWFFGGSLSRIGEIIDRYTRRSEAPRSSLATSQLIERLKRLLDSKAKEFPGKGTIVPHNISLRIQWDKFSTDDNDTTERLERELLAATVDHINDSHYYTLEPINLQVTTDYFTDGVKLIASFEASAEVDDSDGSNITISSGRIHSPVAGSDEQEEPKPLVLEACIEPRGRRQIVRIDLDAENRAIAGRATSSHLSIDHTSVSKYHASISVNSEGQIFVADTGSTNGTFINGDRIAYGQATAVQDTDIVRLGSVEITLKMMPIDSGQEDANSMGGVNGTDGAKVENDIESSEPRKRPEKFD